MMMLWTFLSSFPTVLEGTQSAIQSPRIADLAARIAAGEADALARFWDDVERQGTPLVESLSDDGRYVLVTFLWRGSADTHNVVVIGQLGQLEGTRLVDNQLRKLDGTDVWFRSLWLPSDARTLYRLAANDSLEPTGGLSGAALQARTVDWQPDPMNSRRRVVGNPAATYSVLELPHAPTSQWAAPNSAARVGETSQQTWTSSTLGNERDVWVYTPFGYQTDGEPYPLVVTTDAVAYVNGMSAPTILDNLIAAERIPPVVAVFIGNAAGARTVELSCYRPFADFVTGEVIPWVQESFHVSRDPAENVIVGASLGGLTASCVAMWHPELFGNVLSQSGSYWWKPAGDVEGEWLSRQFASIPMLPLRFYVEVGSLEMGTNAGANPDWIGGESIPYGPSMLVVNRHFRDVLKAKGYPVEYAEVSGGHDSFHFQLALPDGLIALMGPMMR
jgi:enterochelin esterase family protein